MYTVQSTLRTRYQLRCWQRYINSRYSSTQFICNALSICNRHSLSMLQYFKASVCQRQVIQTFMLSQWYIVSTVTLYQLQVPVLHYITVTIYLLQQYINCNTISMLYYINFNFISAVTLHIVTVTLYQLLLHYASLY